MNIVTEIIGPIASATEMNDMIVIITEVMKGGVTLDGGVLAEVWAAAGVVVVIMSVLAGELKAYQLAASGLLLPAAAQAETGGQATVAASAEVWVAVLVDAQGLESHWRRWQGMVMSHPLLPQGSKDLQCAPAPHQQLVVCQPHRIWKLWLQGVLAQRSLVEVYHLSITVCLLSNPIQR
jgi:hypothetical protein